MKIVSNFQDDVCVLVLSGELDSRGNIQLDKTLKELVQAGHYCIVLDLSAIRFLGNQTISLLLSNLKEFRAGDGNIKFLNPQRTVLQYLKSNPMFELFEIFSSRTEAVQSFKDTLPSGKKSILKESEKLDQPTADEPIAFPENLDRFENRFATGEILYANSCMLATLIKSLEQKGILTSEEALNLLNTEQLPPKGVPE